MSLDKKEIPGTDFKELGQLKWPVAVSGYRIIEKPDYSGLPSLEPNKYKWNYIEPFKTPDLYFKLSQTDENNEQAILDFVNEHGALGGDTLVDISNCKETLQHFQLQVRLLRELIDLWYNIYKKKDRSFEELSELEKLNEQLPAKFSHFSILQGAKFKLAHEIVWHLEKNGVYPSMLMNSKADMKPIYSSKTLIGALYLQFYLAFTNRQQLKKCQCGNLFPAYGKRMYCSTKCKNRYVMRERRKK